MIENQTTACCLSGKEFFRQSILKRLRGETGVYIRIKTVTDFLIQWGMKPCMHIVEISIFSQNNQNNVSDRLLLKVFFF